VSQWEVPHKCPVTYEGRFCATVGFPGRQGRQPNASYCSIAVGNSCRRNKLLQACHPEGKEAVDGRGFPSWQQTSVFSVRFPVRISIDVMEVSLVDLRGTCPAHVTSIRPAGLLPPSGRPLFSLFFHN
jgi:hypothetical protein